jgi:hypothetical protein
MRARAAARYSPGLPTRCAHDCSGCPGSEGAPVIGPTGAVRVMVATKPVDFRKVVEGLAMLVRESVCRNIRGDRSQLADRCDLNR